MTFAILFNDGLYTIICKSVHIFLSKPSQATFAQNSNASREEERLNILEQVQKDLHQKSVYRKLRFDISARQIPFAEGDQVLTRVQKAKRGKT